MFSIEMLQLSNQLLKHNKKIIVKILYISKSS